MSARVCVPSSWPICRVVAFRADPELERSGIDDLIRLASHYLDDRVPALLADRIVARERRLPLDLQRPVRGVRLDAVDVLGPLVGLGAMEAHLAADATHVMQVSTRATPRDWVDAHAGVVSFCRGLAREVRGLVYDPLLGIVRPFADSDRPMTLADPVPLQEISRTISVPTRTDRWTFQTRGLANLGLPDLFFEDVAERSVPEAVATIQLACEDLVSLLQRGPGRHAVDGLRVGGALGRVGVRPSRCPQTRRPALRLFPYGQPHRTVGDALRSAGRVLAEA